MPETGNQNGFTLTEILVALAIMGIGFLAVAEMEFLSMRQRQRADAGTIATNVIQFVSERDLAEVRRRHLLNLASCANAGLGVPFDLSYCNGSATSICNACPCNPLEVLTPNPVNGVVNEPTCAAVNALNLDHTDLNFRTTGAECDGDADAVRAADGSLMYVVKQATTTQAQVNGQQTLTVSIAYAVKTQVQVNRELSRGGDGFSVEIRDSLASQASQITAFLDTDPDRCRTLGWFLTVPNIP